LDRKIEEPAPGPEVVEAGSLPIRGQLRRKADRRAPIPCFQPKQPPNNRRYDHCLRPDLMVRGTAEWRLIVSREQFRYISERVAVGERSIGHQRLITHGRPAISI